MPFIKVTQADEEERGQYINSDRVQSIEPFDAHAIVNFESSALAITRESADYFLQEVEAKDANVAVSEVPARPLRSRLATYLRDDAPEGMTLLELHHGPFSDASYEELRDAASTLYGEKVIDVDALSGRLIHRSHLQQPGTLLKHAPFSEVTPSPDPSTEASAHNYDPQDDSERS